MTTCDDLPDNSPTPALSDASMDSNEPLRQQLLSFRGSTLKLPADCQVLTPEAVTRPALDRQTLLQTIQERVLENEAPDGIMESQRSCRLLLLLPDKTRRQTAARLAVDALIDLCEREDRFTLTIVFGLGTHPRMTPDDITRILGSERQQRLIRLNVALHQQTTLNPLPRRRIRIADPLASKSNEMAIQMPEILWNCDLLLVAGDTDLHPYEGRAGSGGIHKMLAIGVGCLSTIRMTHSLDILTDPLTRPGEKGNRFVELVDYFAKEIINALRTPRGPLIAAPIGISTVALRVDQPEAFWIGDREEERTCLMQPLKQERTVAMREAVDVVIADTEEEKGTDLLAGARSLHFLCNFNKSNNPILCKTSPWRTALLFNGCHEMRNAHGIGNSGTVLH
ncbi:MAG: lactate racemase domain-containing protein, partial [Cyanobacteriota bacterium]